MIETSKTGRRICFSHPFASGDLKWAQTKIEAVAVTAGIAASKDSAAAITTKVAAVVKATAALPVDWSPLKEGDIPPGLKPTAKAVAPSEPIEK